MGAVELCTPSWLLNSQLSRLSAGIDDIQSEYPRQLFDPRSSSKEEFSEVLLKKQRLLQDDKARCAASASMDGKQGSAAAVIAAHVAQAFASADGMGKRRRA